MILRSLLIRRINGYQAFDFIRITTKTVVRNAGIEENAITLVKNKFLFTIQKPHFPLNNEHHFLAFMLKMKICFPFKIARNMQNVRIELFILT